VNGSVDRAGVKTSGAASVGVGAADAPDAADEVEEPDAAFETEPFGTADSAARSTPAMATLCTAGFTAP
jgi:hypothetical protein